MIIPCDNDVFRTEDGNYILSPGDKCGYGIHEIDTPYFPYSESPNNSVIFNNNYYVRKLVIHNRDIGLEILKLLEKDNSMAKDPSNFEIGSSCGCQSIENPLPAGSTVRTV